MFVNPVTRLALMLAALLLPLSAHAQTKETFQDWLVTCQEKDGNKRCALSQTLKDTKSNKPILSWIVTRTKDGDKAIVRIPTGISIPEGLTIAVTGLQPIKAGFRFCAAQACAAEIVFNDVIRDAFKTQADFSATFTVINGKPITIKGSLKGFTAAYDAFDKGAS